MDYRGLLQSVRLKPSMWLFQSEVQYDNLVAFVLGLDIGSQGAMLNGFDEFLVLNGAGPPSYHWSARARRKSGSATVDAEDEQAAVDCLFDQLDEFLAEVAVRDGRKRIHHEYALWFQASGRDLELERFRTSPRPETVTLEEAIERLGVERSELFDLIAAHQLRPARIGADLLLRRDEVEKLAQTRSADATDDKG